MTLRPVFLDTEFITTCHGPDGLISLALTDHQGTDFYAVNSDMNIAALHNNPWLLKHVWPQLPLTPGGDLDLDHPDVRPLADIATGAARYFSTHHRQAHLHAWYAAQDVVRLHQLWDNDWARMPEDVPRWATDIQSLIAMAGDLVLLPTQDTPEHHALNDARYNRDLYDYTARELRTRGIHL
ncbi:hypothetical protein ABTX81_30270 [Kitasatospora sp. NPDC097605]|uniref:hypothetical protein n=1 Tax=Kitasatospora sp. NPDC097605 TaxID=3157226 RepID=UPI00331B3CC5